MLGDLHGWRSRLRRRLGLELEADVGEETMETCRRNIRNSSKILFMQCQKENISQINVTGK
jgi:hypothetical protein